MKSTNKQISKNKQTKNQKNKITKQNNNKKVQNKTRTKSYTHTGASHSLPHILHRRNYLAIAHMTSARKT